MHELVIKETVLYASLKISIIGFISGTQVWFIICDLKIFMLNLNPLIFSLMKISLQMNNLEDLEAADTIEHDQQGLLKALCISF